MHLDTTSADAPIARMACPTFVPPAELESEICTSFPVAYMRDALKAFKGLPDADRDMAVMQIMSLRDHVKRMHESLGGASATLEQYPALKRAYIDLYWRTRVIALSDQVRGVGA